MPEISVKIIAFYAGLNALIMFTLALMVVRARRKTGVGLGHDEPTTLLRRAYRAQANNVEYVPMALILLGILELAQSPALFLHLLGGMLTVGRIAHAWGLSRSGERSPGRAVGIVLTWISFLTAAFAVLVYAVA
ncbi:MAG: MAPEG family protein [Alphaproteobacteria bacterium]